ncbi:MAG TPA: histidine phosphatase family protein [Dehalococcoidia bacterium]|nr:histidine phosphatase family protein [Dehalococcoidia bacterium]
MNDGSDQEALANVDVERRLDERAAREGRPSPLDVAFLSNRTPVTEVLLIRHAHQHLDLGGPIGGYLDPPLSPLGARQAQLLGAALSTTRIDAVYTSPLRRALATAEAIGRHHRLPAIATEELKEIAVFRDAPQNISSLDLMGSEVLATLRHRFIRERSWDVYPYSEPSSEFRRRVVNAIETVISSHADQRVAVVCHGGVINAYVSYVLGSTFDVLFRPAHTSISIVATGDGVHTLYTLNDVHHLSAGVADLRSV